MPLVLSAIFAGGMWLGWILNSSHSLSGGEKKLMSVLEIINDKYVDEIDMDSLVEMAIPALLNNLDPHSAYIPKTDFEMVNSELEGFSGVGISFDILNDTLCVVEVITDGPAERVGVQAGDRIIKVDDKPIAGTGLTPDDVRAMLRGKKGTDVTITVKRGLSRKPLTFKITRDDIPTVYIDAAYMCDDRTGYIKVSKFARDTYDEFLQALNRLRIEGAQDYVIDLRGNTGGYMEPAILMANEFLEPGQVIVSTKGRDRSEDQIVLSDGSGAFTDFGVAVIIDEFSASASEIFSGAIQDNDRGWIIGRRSFGKGLVQRPIMMPDSSEVRLTVQRYYTPAGRCIQKDYKLGDRSDYDAELINRFNNGELLSADSVRFNPDDRYTTFGGRTVYGGGGIMPDHFVPRDTAAVTKYYEKIINKGLMIDFAYEYADLNRDDLSAVETVDEFRKKLPSDDMLLVSFVRYAAQNGVPAQWYYINTSSKLIVNQLKALIARNVLGLSAYYEIINVDDKALDIAREKVRRPPLDADVSEKIATNE